MTPTGLIASIRQRLMNLAKEQGEPFDYVLLRYGVERFLYRLSVSDQATRFVLKGAMLFRVWGLDDHRPTRDLDLLGLIQADTESVREAILAIIETNAAEDALVFQKSSLRVEPIREENLYGGVRAKMIALLGNVRIPLQIDVGFGDSVTPPPEPGEFPALLEGFPKPKLRIYQAYTVIAEKLEALVTLDAQNSRMKDFFDLWTLLTPGKVDREKLRAAIDATFARRKTAVPKNLPLGLTSEFAHDREAMWQAFLRKNGLGNRMGPLADVVRAIAQHLPYEWECAP